MPPSNSISSVYFTYLICCSDGSYYVGITTDIERRLRQHNGQLAGGARYTRNRRPVVLAYVEQHKTKSDAAKREYILKKLSHKEKEQLGTLRDASLLSDLTPTLS